MSTAARWLATWFGCGLAPRAPGTVGSLGAVPLHLLLVAAPVPLHAVCVITLALVGVWAAQQFALGTGTRDPQQVVIDEVSGTLIAMAITRGLGVFAAAGALVAFRVFDIWKPWPIRRFEHARPLGLGIMLDDWAAGLLAGLLVRVIAAV
jgi:phosphatidylglycerophosphatase A